MKIKKYIKLVLCTLIILSMMLPSYAALSSSDGSAFVTKSEFDGAITDFSNRLVKFEAGINSKIDSQITSYLDRNGIWNSKEQEYCKDCIDWTARGTGDAAAGKGWIQILNAQNSGYCNFYLGGFMAFKASKSGLVYLNCRDEQTRHSKASNRDARSHIGFMVNNSTDSWMSDLSAKGFIRLLSMKKNVPDMPSGTRFIRTNNNTKAQCTYGGQTYSLEDDVDKIVVEMTWGDTLANFWQPTNKGSRYATIVYAACSSYQMIGFVEKDVQYAIGFYGKYTYWIGNRQTLAITLDPLAAGCGVVNIPGGEQDFRPEMWIDSIEIY